LSLELDCWDSGAHNIYYICFLFKECDTKVGIQIAVACSIHGRMVDYLCYPYLLSKHTLHYLTFIYVLNIKLCNMCLPKKVFSYIFCYAGGRMWYQIAIESCFASARLEEAENETVQGKDDLRGVRWVVNGLVGKPRNQGRLIGRENAL